MAANGHISEGIFKKAPEVFYSGISKGYPWDIPGEILE